MRTPDDLFSCRPQICVFSSVNPLILLPEFAQIVFSSRCCSKHSTFRSAGWWQCPWTKSVCLNTVACQTTDKTPTVRSLFRVSAPVHPVRHRGAGIPVLCAHGALHPLRAQTRALAHHAHLLPRNRWVRFYFRFLIFLEKLYRLCFSMLCAHFRET